MGELKDDLKDESIVDNSKSEDIANANNKETPVDTEKTIDADVNLEEEKEDISVEDRQKEELEKEKDKYLRLFAEFENYKRRTSKERIELYKTANKDLMLALLPVLDDFDRGMVEIEKSEDTTLVEGVKLISNKLKDILKQKNLQEVEVKQGDDFDSDVHEAITQIPAPSDDLKGKIIDVVETGYQLGDVIVRYPKVVIGTK